MKRTKDWWARLTPDERYFVWCYERQKNIYWGRGGYLPDNCSECPVCSDPCLGNGPCLTCIRKHVELIRKANGGVHEPAHS